MSLWYPTIPLRQLPAHVAITLLGAAVAGLYGALHDQVSYTLSPEYFTKMKFRQFAWADVGWSPRAFAASVGFLGSWWAGLIAGWLLARFGLAELWLAGRRAAVVKAIAIVPLVAALTGFAGAGLGAVVAHGSDLAGWQDWQRNFALDDLPGFVIVAYLHYASYAGAVMGTLAALWATRRSLKDFRSSQMSSSG